MLRIEIVYLNSHGIIKVIFYSTLMNVLPILFSTGLRRFALISWQCRKTPSAPPPSYRESMQK